MPLRPSLIEGAPSTVFSVGKGSVFASFGSNEPEKQRFCRHGLPVWAWREGGKALTLHEPFRKVGAGEVLWLMPRVLKRQGRTGPDRRVCWVLLAKNHRVWGG